MPTTLNKRARRKLCDRVADCHRGDTVHGSIYLCRRIRGGWLARTVNPVTLLADDLPAFWVSPVTVVLEVIETAEKREWRARMEWEDRK